MKNVFFGNFFCVMAITGLSMGCNTFNKGNTTSPGMVAGLKGALEQTDFGPSLYGVKSGKNMTLEEMDFISILKKNPYGVLATHDGETIKTQIFQCLFTDGIKVFFGTSSTKPVYEQLQINQNVAFCTYLENYIPVLSIYGKAVFVEDMALKTRALNEASIVKSIFEVPDNPIFKMFYIDIEQIETFTYAEGTKIYVR